MLKIFPYLVFLLFLSHPALRAQELPFVKASQLPSDDSLQHQRRHPDSLHTLKHPRIKPDSAAARKLAALRADSLRRIGNLKIDSGALALTMSAATGGDTASRRPDSVRLRQQQPRWVAGRGRPSYYQLLKSHPWFNFFSVPVFHPEQDRQVAGKEGLFYLFAALLTFFAVVRLVFSRYLNNLLALVFRASLKQKQIREQLMQTPLASLLLNALFVVVAGIYISFLLQHAGIAEKVNFWILLAYCSGVVAAVYLVKYLTLKFTGWVFNMREAADTYLFLVFLVNKLLGIFLLPLLILMAFADPGWWEPLVTVSYIMVGGFFVYRYLVSFAPVRREAKVSQFHFFVYLCAFEIAPLLLIYKLLLKYI